MQQHTKNYFNAFGYDQSDFIPCEVCGSPSVDIHHVILRSKFGSKTKHEQDAIENIIALCRHHHDLAHGVDAAYWKEIFLEIIKTRMKTSRTKSSPCPYCGYIVDSASGNGTPEKDCISICIKCAGLSQFNEDLTLRKIDEDAYRVIIEDDETREEIQKYQRIISAK